MTIHSSSKRTASSPRSRATLSAHHDNLPGAVHRPNHGLRDLRPWMYLDTRGLVTVGVGQMLPDPPPPRRSPSTTPTASPPPPTPSSTTSPASAPSPAAQSCHAYRCATSLILPDDIITALLTAATTANDAVLRPASPTTTPSPPPPNSPCSTWPTTSASPKLLRQYPLLLAAVEGQHWLVASQQCHRNGPGPDRNQWTAQQFLLAAPLTLNRIASPVPHHSLNLGCPIRCTLSPARGRVHVGRK